MRELSSLGRHARQHARRSGSFFFCKTPDCDVVHPFRVRTGLPVDLDFATAELFGKGPEVVLRRAKTNLNTKPRA